MEASGCPMVSSSRVLLPTRTAMPIVPKPLASELTPALPLSPTITSPLSLFLSRSKHPGPATIAAQGHPTRRLSTRLQPVPQLGWMLARDTLETAIPISDPLTMPTSASRQTTGPMNSSMLATSMETSSVMACTEVTLMALELRHLPPEAATDVVADGCRVFQPPFPFRDEGCPCHWRECCLPFFRPHC